MCNTRQAYCSLFVAFVQSKMPVVAINTEFTNPFNVEIVGDMNIS